MHVYSAYGTIVCTQLWYYYIEIWTITIVCSCDALDILTATEILLLNIFTMLTKYLSALWYYISPVIVLSTSQLYVSVCTSILEATSE